MEKKSTYSNIKMVQRLREIVISSYNSITYSINYTYLITFFGAVFLFACNESNNGTKNYSSAFMKSESSKSLLPTNSTISIAKEIIANQKSRVRDAYGSGQYGASRDAGARTHNGIDIIVDSGEKVFSPIKCNIIRQAMPYKNDPNYKGIVLKGIEEWDGYELKIFYVEGLFSGGAIESQEIGSAQNLTLKYPGITNHIHLEVKYLGAQVDPFSLWQYSF